MTAERNMSEEVRMNGTGNAPVTPKLAVPEPKVGQAAPSDPPAISMEKLQEIIKEQVEEQVAERIKAIEAGELDKEALTGQDQQFSNFEKKLEVYGVDLGKVLPGMKTHWFNDDGDRIPRMRVRGYEFVTRVEVALNDNKLTPLNADLGEYVAVYVGKKANGDPMRAFLMKIPQDKFERSYEHAQEHNDKIERAIQRGEMGNALAQGGYVGTDGPSGVKVKYEPRTGMSLARRPT